VAIVDPFITIPGTDPNVLYAVTGAVLHRGGAHGGHYRALILESDGEWYLYDDNRVHRVGEDRAYAFKKCNVPLEVAVLRYARV
jgi:ubiquitin C-terminal hydrolase